MDNWFLIANPISGGNRCKRELPDIIKLLNKHGISFTKSFTKKRKHAIAIVRDAVEKGFRKIICAGGDGTANEIVNGILTQNSVAPEEITLAVIIGDIGKLGIIRHSGKLKTGEIGKVGKVQLIKGKHISITSDRPILFEADGEALGMTPLTFDVIPKTLRIITV